MRRPSGIEFEFIPISSSGPLQPRAGRQCIAWRRQPRNPDPTNDQPEPPKGATEGAGQAMSDRKPAIARSTVVCRPRRGLGFTTRVIPSISRDPLGLTPPGYELPPLRGWVIPSISPPLGVDLGGRPRLPGARECGTFGHPHFPKAKRGQPSSLCARKWVAAPLHGYLGVYHLDQASCTRKGGTQSEAQAKAAGARGPAPSADPCTLAARRAVSTLLGTAGPW